MPSDAELLLEAIEQFPDNDQPRLEYADELEKDGYNPRAELIRSQCELARMLKGEFLILPETAKGSRYYTLQIRERERSTRPSSARVRSARTASESGLVPTVMAGILRGQDAGSAMAPATLAG